MALQGNALLDIASISAQLAALQSRLEVLEGTIKVATLSQEEQAAERAPDKPPESISIGIVEPTPEEPGLEPTASSTAGGQSEVKETKDAPSQASGLTHNSNDGDGDDDDEVEQSECGDDGGGAENVDSSENHEDGESESCSSDEEEEEEEEERQQTEESEREKLRWTQQLAQAAIEEAQNRLQLHRQQQQQRAMSSSAATSCDGRGQQGATGKRGAGRWASKSYCNGCWKRFRA